MDDPWRCGRNQWRWRRPRRRTGQERQVEFVNVESGCEIQGKNQQNSQNSDVNHERNGPIKRTAPVVGRISLQHGFRKYVLYRSDCGWGKDYMLFCAGGRLRFLKK
jgi:hypothetical protein